MAVWVVGRDAGGRHGHTCHVGAGVREVVFGVGLGLLVLGLVLVGVRAGERAKGGLRGAGGGVDVGLTGVGWLVRDVPSVKEGRYVTHLEGGGVLVGHLG